MSALRTLHVVHASDSHVRSGDERHADLRALSRVVERVRRWHDRGVPIDVLVHTGDLVDDADDPNATPDTTRAALSVLDALPVPWFLLGGNHDRRAFLVPEGHPSHRRPDGLGETLAGDADGIALRVVADVLLIFVDLDPESGDERSTSGVVRPSTVPAVAKALDEHPGRSAAFLHYPPLAQEATWAAPPRNGHALHAVFAERAARLHGVFVGHNHRALVHVRDGVTYATAPALARQFLLWPGQDVHAPDDEPVSGLHYLTLGADGTTRIQHHGFVTGA